MISNLPLLFADGHPTCLDKITLSQLEKFVPFMIECACGNNLKKSTAPSWWPTGLQFSIPLVKPAGIESKWLFILKNLVFRCYSYHDCEFMLRFCSDLSQLSSSELKYVNSWDGTTSLYNKATGKLLVTFRNENLFYDKKKNSPKKTLLSKSNGQTGEQQAMVQPPLYDVYLCDNCDDEFSSLQEVQEHEKNCCRKQQELSPPSPVITEEETKESFLKYFCLASSQEIGTVKKTDHPVRKRSCRNYLRFAGIPISSPLGHLVYKKTHVSPATSTVQLERLERYCVAKPFSVNARSRTPGSIPWPVSWKPRKKPDESDNWVHVYRNPGRQWRTRKPSVQNKLHSNYKRLVSQCQNFQVRLKKLTPHEIEFYTSASSHPRSASINHTRQSDPVIQLSRSADSNVNSSSRKVCVSSENRLSRINKSATSNTKNSATLKPACTPVNRKSLDTDLKTRVSPTITKTFPVKHELLPHMTYEYKTLSAKQTKVVAGELKPITVIDLVSSDEENI